MSNYTWQQTGTSSNSTGGMDDCPSDKDPADQPHPPGDSCEKLPESTPPVLEEPKKCESPCKCTGLPDSDPNCLENLIADQTAQITAADTAKMFKADLEALLGKARTANQEYTRDKYRELVDKWKVQDGEIAQLIRKLVCAVPCWRCIIECHVCTLVNELHYAEQKLYGDGTLYSDVHNLYDLRYWHERDLEKKKLRLERVKNVLTAWEKPVQAIDKVLADNARLIADAGKSLGSDAPKVVYDVFLRLVPMHLAIAPPRTMDTTTKIEKVYTEFCMCDEGSPDNCCGPDVGERKWSLRQRLIGPQPYLIDPNLYLKLICCLVKERYGPAKDALAKAEASYQSVDDKIKRYKAQVEDGLKNFDKIAKGTIPSVLDCSKYEPCKPEQQPSHGY
jgi:hypothetical protein